MEAHAEEVFSCAGCKAASVRPGQFIDPHTWVCSQECRDAVTTERAKYGVSPEPWEAWFDYDDDGAIYQAGVDSGPDRAVNVCMTTCENIEVDDVATHNKIVIADTTLIAAAPKMLAALESLFEHCVMAHKHWGEGCNQRQANAAIKAGRAAIEAAKGGA